MEHKTQITEEYLNFINDMKLRKILYQRLDELNRIFLVNSNFSTVFLSISTLEGILKYVSKTFKTQITASSNYPNNKSGTGKKRFDKLTIDEMYDLLKEIDILPDIKNFKEVYNLFRDYRNFIHPQAQLKKQWAITLGQAQMAVGILNATIDHLKNSLFINNEKYKRIAGFPDYIEDVIHLNVDRLTRWNSFLIRDYKISQPVKITFDLELSEGAIFNFIFNYKDTGNFKMIRLDNRRRGSYINSVLHSTQPQYWTTKLKATDQFKHPPEKEVLTIQIHVNFSSNNFLFKVDGDIYTFKNLRDRAVNLFDEISPDLKIGFFNELNTVKIANFRIS